MRPGFCMNCDIKDLEIPAVYYYIWKKDLDADDKSNIVCAKCDKCFLDMHKSISSFLYILTPDEIMCLEIMQS